MKDVFFAAEQSIQFRSTVLGSIFLDASHFETVRRDIVRQEHLPLLPGYGPRRARINLSEPSGWRQPANSRSSRATASGDTSRASANILRNCRSCKVSGSIARRAATKMRAACSGLFRRAAS